MERTLKRSPNRETDWQISQSGVGSVRKRKETQMETNQKGHFHIRQVDADWLVDIKGKHMMIGWRSQRSDGTNDMRQQRGIPQ